LQLNLSLKTNDIFSVKKTHLFAAKPNLRRFN